MSIEANKRYEAEHPNGGEANPKLQRANNLIIAGLQPTPIFTGENIKYAAEQQRIEKLNKWKEYKKGIDATITATELGFSGASLLGAYANWKNWANAANTTKQVIANLLQKTKLPTQVGGTLIDGYQIYDALQNNDDFNSIYNGISTGAGALGTLGASDIFLNSRYYNPYIDRGLGIIGVLQNTGDFIKFGYDTYKKITNNKQKVYYNKVIYLL